MSILDKIAKQVYENNKAWIDNIVKFINDKLAIRDPAKSIILLYLNNGLTSLDTTPTNIEQTYNILNIVFATVGVVVERTQILYDNRIYNGLSIDCRALLIGDKFNALKLYQTN